MPLVADFGLAKLRDDADSSEQTRSGEVLGTPRYMAPEQAAGQTAAIGVATDVYGLGAILYEVLTFRPPFLGENDVETRRQVIERDPVGPKTLRTGLPRDLETICLKCLRKGPNERYVSARALADDLHRFLDGSPIAARRASPLERSVKWGLRHKTVVAAIVGVFVVLIAAVLLYYQEREKTFATNASQFVALTQQILRLRTTPPSDGRSQEAWELVRKASKIPGQDRGTLQALAVSTLIGLDARITKTFPESGASSVAFNDDGTKLLMGGCTDPNDRKKGQHPARLWDEAIGQTRELKGYEKGPVGFLADETPIQLVRTSDGPALINLETGRPIHTFPIDGEVESEDEDVSPMSMTRDGSRVGAAVRLTSGEHVIAVWDGTTGKALRVLEFQGRCLTFSRDGSLVAAGDADGQVQVWSVGQGTLVSSIQVGRTPVHCVKLHRERRTEANPTSPQLDNWLLATGAAGGAVSVWEVGTRVRRAKFHGVPFDTYALAFSPDGTVLASCGRNEAFLWSISTNPHLLTLSGFPRNRGLGNYTFGPGVLGGRQTPRGRLRRPLWGQGACLSLRPG